jgi:hypothetical protein
MGAVETAFAYAVAILAAVAVIGALTAVLVWEWGIIRRTLAANRPPTPEERFWRDHRAVRIPERRADA